MASPDERCIPLDAWYFMLAMTIVAYIIVLAAITVGTAHLVQYLLDTCCERWLFWWCHNAKPLPRDPEADDDDDDNATPMTTTI